MGKRGGAAGRVSGVTSPRRGHRRTARGGRGRRLAVVVALAVLLVGGVLVGRASGVIPVAGTAAPTAEPTDAPSPGAVPGVPPRAAGAAPHLQVGVVGSEAPEAPDRIAGLGAHVMRDEFTASTTVDQLAPVVDRLAARGIRLQPLVGWDDGTPAPDLTGVAAWAAAFGPGGSHWAGRAVPASVAMTDIELGNENAFYYKSGLPDDDRYRNLATVYGQRAVGAARAVNRANPAVGVLVELESADGERPAWIDGTLAAGGPDLVRLMHGPTIHPYGPDWRKKIDRDAAFLHRRGVTAPFFVTEWGISSDDGPALIDNYDWPVDLSYARAGALLTTALRQMGADSRVRQVLLYQLDDQRDPGSDTDREHYFGLLRADGSDKGGYSDAVRALCRTFP